jgi:RNA polymerase sigma factor (TIGR02999 family)
MTEITTLLQALNSGDSRAADQVVALLYDELRRLARSRLRRAGELTLLDTTALVHESYLRLVHGGELTFADRRAFFGYAAQVMRSVIVDAARARLAERRGGAAPKLTLSTDMAHDLAHDLGRDEAAILAVHEALQALQQADERAAQMVELRYFGGYSDQEIAEVLDVTERTVQRDWNKARLLLRVMLAPD